MEKYNTLSDTQLDRIMECVATPQTEQGFASVVSHSELKTNDYNLNLPRYVDTFEPEPLVNVGQVALDMLAAQKKIDDANKAIASMMAEQGIPMTDIVAMTGRTGRTG